MTERALSKVIDRAHIQSLYSLLPNHKFVCVDGETAARICTCLRDKSAPIAYQGNRVGSDGVSTALTLLTTKITGSPTSLSLSVCFSLTHSLTLLITGTCCYDEIKGTKDQDFSCTFSDSHSHSLSLVLVVMTKSKEPKT